VCAILRTHVAFGLRWLSDVYLADLPIVNDGGPPDVRLWVKTWPSAVNESEDAVLWYASPNQSGDSWLRVFWLSRGEFFLVRYGDGTDFLIHQSGSQVWCRWRPEFSFEYVATYLYGPISGFLLRLRGVVCLHASVVGIDNWAVAFMGPAGAGKSTLAAAFAGSGFPVLSDDVLALTELEGVFQATPAYPRLRLWPASVGALFGSPEALPRITAGWDKRHLDLTAEAYQFESDHRSLGAIYVLGERSDDCAGPRIEALEGATGLSCLIANTYAYKMFDKKMRAHEFNLLSRLAEQLPLRSVVPFADLTQIERLCELVRGDFQTLPRPAWAPGPGGRLHV
jgi:hypothetical protein